MPPKQKEDHRILAVHVTDRLRQVAKVQGILTRYGKHIKTRVGLHETDGRKKSLNGVILLECLASARQFDALTNELNGVAGVEAKAIVFSH